MVAEGRTRKSVRNSLVSFSFFTIKFILNFYSRKIFLDYLGTEILGLNTTAVSILQFLNLAEMGIGTAVGFTLYKPIYDRDEKSINEIVSLQGHLYRRIANFIILGSCVVMCFFPWIFHKMSLPLWYAYASFIVLLYGALLGYYVNYRQVVLSSAQMDYKIQYSTNSWGLLKIICQIIALSHFSYPYIWWLGLEVVFSTISALTLSIVTKKSFPFLKKSEVIYKDLKEKYSDFIKKIKQMFVHQIAAFTLGQSTSLIIYGFTTLSVVALYGNYLTIVTGVMTMLAAVFNSIGAGIGNLVAQGDKQHELKIFQELFSLRFLVSSTIAFVLLICVQPFISLWIGKEYLLPFSSICFIILTLFIRLNRYTVANFINAHGLYQDIWAPLAEAGLNIGLSIILGYFWGLNGILCGVSISLILIVEIWKPYFLFSKGIKVCSRGYFLSYGLHLLFALIAGSIVFLIINRIRIEPSHSWFSLIIYAAIVTILFIIVLGGMLSIFTPGMKNFISRIKR